MRQGQQNRRGRGRGRKVQNPLSRNYESSGPEVKIRGNASHIAEKYTTLARDAAASGDSVTAENYLQHAEHYNRIIMAAQVQSAGAQPADSANGADNQRTQPADDEDGGRQPASVSANGGDQGVEVEQAADGGKANGSGGGPEKVKRSKSADKAPPDNAAA